MRVDGRANVQTGERASRWVYKQSDCELMGEERTNLRTDRRMEGKEGDELGGVDWVGERRAIGGWASGEKAGYRMCEIASDRACE